MANTSLDGHTRTESPFLSQFVFQGINEALLDQPILQMLDIERHTRSSLVFHLLTWLNRYLNEMEQLEPAAYKNRSFHELIISKRNWNWNFLISHTNWLQFSFSAFLSRNTSSVLNFAVQFGENYCLWEIIIHWTLLYDYWLPPFNR